ncbi:hypothetical protein [Nonomuraea dietziae]|uniref:hypothetical protein n=1 Tax=Nonomuraea dietziae TaxID=65515 RepID=UPI0033F72553
MVLTMVMPSGSERSGRDQQPSHQALYLDITAGSGYIRLKGAAIGQARTGPPARYCATPCRQAAHRARRRTTETASRAARLRERLAGDATDACQLADELAVAIAAIPAVDGGQDSGQPTG